MNADVVMSEFDNEPKPSRRLWIFAALGALALHLGGAALAVTHLRASNVDDTFGAQAIEVGLQLTSPELDETDLPLGPGTEASAPSQQSVEQKPEVQQAELPKDVPTNADDPDQAVAPSEEKKPEEEEDPKAAAMAAPEAEAVRETAKQTIDAPLPRTDVAMAPNIGLGKDTQKLKAEWGAKIRAYLLSHLRYPKVRKDKTVTIRVSLVLDRQGHLLSVGISQSSGDPIFDKAAISMVRRSAPLPRPPVALTDDQFAFALPMRFKVKGTN
jgi:periplasmic protein TonB